MQLDKGAAKFSHHSLNRAEEQGLTCSELVKAWFRSEPYELGLRQRAYKFRTYGLASLDDFYAFDQITRTIFTCHKDGKYVIIITVTHKELTTKQKKDKVNICQPKP